VEILEMRALRGPNRYSRYQVIFMELDLGKYEELPTDKLPGFKDRIVELIPSLYDHRCSPGHPGGLIERMERGTWLGHVTEHVAIELQCLAATEVGFGKTLDTKRKGIYHVVFRYRDEEMGMAAGRAAVDIVEAVVEGRDVDLPPIIDELKEIREDKLLGPSTRSIVNEAKSRDIPYLRLNRYSYVQLGHGVNQRRIQATMTDRTSAIGVEIADDKMRTKEILKTAGVPIPEGENVEDLDGALDVADDIGYPVVVKPLVGNHGRGITVNIGTPEDLQVAFEQAKRFRDTIVVERYLPGSDHRVLVINGKFVAAARRDPASVTGDGVSTVQQLIDRLNEDPQRGYGHEKVLTMVKVDFMTERLLSQLGKDLDTVLPEGEQLVLKSTANLSQGGTSTDVTDEVHPFVRHMAERIATIIDIDIMGIDIIAPHLREPLESTGGGVVEVNAAPGFRMHVAPFHGEPRNVAAPVVDMLFPPGTTGRIPIIAVTGTNGKTTVARLIAHILKITGRTVGMSGTGGVVIGNDRILEGDYSGPEGTMFVLREPSVDAAVLEVARGAILRRGLAYDEADVGVFLNVSSDHLGQEDVDTVEELADVKGIVVETVKEKGRAVLNAGDHLVVRFKDSIKARSILFSTDPDLPVLREHLDGNGTVVTVVDDTIVLRKKALDFPIAKVRDVPMTLEGAATFNVSNALAATAACYALGIPAKGLERGLITFNPSTSQSRGRMNIIDVADYKVLVDYGHNPAAVRALSSVFPSLTTSGRVIGMHSGTGNRRDEDIMEFGRVLGTSYDHIVLTDSDPRRRTLGETAEVVRKGILDTGFPEEELTVILDVRKATRAALEMAGTGDLVVLQCDDVEQVLADVAEYKEEVVRECEGQRE
jgi:cyanophycin synthetase